MCSPSCACTFFYFLHICRRQEEIQILQEQRRALLKERPGAYLAAKRQVHYTPSSLNSNATWSFSFVGRSKSNFLGRAAFGYWCCIVYQNIVRRTILAHGMLVVVTLLLGILPLQTVVRPLKIKTKAIAILFVLAESRFGLITHHCGFLELFKSLRKPTKKRLYFIGPAAGMIANFLSQGTGFQFPSQSYLLKWRDVRIKRLGP